MNILLKAVSAILFGLGSGGLAAPEARAGTADVESDLSPSLNQLDILKDLKKCVDGHLLLESRDISKLARWAVLRSAAPRAAMRSCA